MKKLIAVTALLITYICVFIFNACSSNSESPTGSVDESLKEIKRPEEPVPDHIPEETTLVPEDVGFQHLLGEIQKTIDEGEKLEIHVKGEYETNPANDIIATIMDDTVIVDAVTGAPVCADKLQADDKAQAYISDAATMLLPPITDAFAVIANIPARTCLVCQPIA